MFQDVSRRVIGEDHHNLTFAKHAALTGWRLRPRCAPLDSLCRHSNNQAPLPTTPYSARVRFPPHRRTPMQKGKNAHLDIPAKTATAHKGQANRVPPSLTFSSAAPTLPLRPSPPPSPSPPPRTFTSALLSSAPPSAPSAPLPSAPPPALAVSPLARRGGEFFPGDSPESARRTASSKSRS